jgi:hypothetical protein
MLLSVRIHRVFVTVAAFGLIQAAAQTPKPAEVAPGVTLPTGGDATVFALDATAAGPALVHIKPHEILIAAHAASNFLRAQVFAGPHATVELESPHADTTLASTKAVFFIRLSGEDAEIMRSRVHLLWLQPSKKRREITDFSMNVFGGQRTRNVDDVPSDTEMVEGTNWLRVTPKEPLLPGEFAIALLPKDVNQESTAVYDFGVPGDKSSANNPYAAGANPDAKKKP